MEVSPPLNNIIVVIRLSFAHISQTDHIYPFSWWRTLLKQHNFTLTFISEFRPLKLKANKMVKHVRRERTLRPPSVLTFIDTSGAETFRF